MDTKIIVGIVAAVVIVIGGFFLMKPSDTSNSSSETKTNEEISTTTKNTGKKMAFSEFLKQDGSYKCTVHQYVNNTDTVGITYINEGMIRGEYNTEVQGINIDTSFIVREGYTYAWSSLSPNIGFKIKTSEGGINNSSSSTQGNYSFNAEQIGDYDCEAWTADVALFTIPTGITFKDLK